MSQPANDDFSQHLSDDEASYHEDASENGTATNKPKQQQQQLIPTTTTISNIKLPILKKEEYDIWAMEMEHYLEYIDNDVWKVIHNGNSKKRISIGKDGVVRILPLVSAAEIHAVEKKRKARTILLMAIPKEHLRIFHEMNDAKEIWEAIRTRFGGNANSKKMQKAVLKQQFEAFTISSSERLEKGYDRSLPSAWSNLAMTMRTKPDVDTLSIDDFKSSTNKVKSGHAGVYSTCTPSTSSNNIPEREVPVGFADKVIYSLFAKQSKDLDLLHEDLEQIDDMDIQEMDINWQIAMIVIRMKKFYKKTGRRVRIDGNKPVGFDKKKLECFKCHNTGYFARECPSKETNDGKKRDSFYQDQGAIEEEETKHALMAISSNNEDHPLKNMEDRGIFNSGCSGHMTNNKDHLDDFDECKGGSVTFGGSKGYITGKGRIRVGNLDFDSVSFVKELGHFNLFSISQICDKHHKVLFTKTECLIVSLDFKMPDENQILLKVHRQHNMYSFDMKTPSLIKDYACLITKAIFDESKLWHRRLGHINFKNLNKLVKENLVRGLPSKVFRNDHICVACQKGKQHKASCKAKLVRTITKPLHTLHMDLFGPTSVKSINHASYCLVITDDCTRFSWVFFLATKDETSGILQNFIRQIENQLNHRVKIIRSDNGTEFKNRDVGNTKGVGHF
ncbi:putative ribonuclease H-like domain-containing protein [Tanacetum coccineum]